MSTLLSCYLLNKRIRYKCITICSKGYDYYQFCGSRKRTSNGIMSLRKCSIEGYQYTLYAAYGQQFFFDCQIYGTIDFIFGNAAVIIQNFFIYLRKPLQGQANVITAEGREFKKNNTGIVIHNCTFTSAPEFIPYKATVRTYLGRPWKEFSRTIIMQSFLDDLIDPNLTAHLLYRLCIMLSVEILDPEHMQKVKSTGLATISLLIPRIHFHCSLEQVGEVGSSFAVRICFQSGYAYLETLYVGCMFPLSNNLPLLLKYSGSKAKERLRLKG
ncbi:Pectinesterase [Theobroma cacao]|nr:Pectinesterase [Theobroma cacao]